MITNRNEYKCSNYYLIMNKIEKRINAIEKRNKKVELNKSWEISLTRKIIIITLTYLTMVLFFIFAQLPKPFINSIVPSIAFILSTLSLPFFKKLWIKNK